MFIFRILVLITLSLNIFYAKDWEYKDWSVGDLAEQGYLRTITHGTAVWGHEFGILKPKNNCDVDILWLTFSTYEKNVEDLKGKNLTFNVAVDNEKFTLDLDVVNIFKMTPIMSVALFTNFQMNENFIKLLKKSNNIEFTIFKPENLAKKFDMPSDTFSLNGFVANYTKLQESCKDIKQLLIPPPKIEPEPKEIKTYETKNLITDHSKCDGSKINKYIENESREGDEFTVSNDYLYFSFGNDGQDEYEDINVVNVCNPLKPKLVTKISNTASQVFGFYTDDRYLYVDSSAEDGNNFQIIDIENNKLISKIKLETFINPFVVKNNLLYIAEDLNVSIYDLKKKNNPKLLNKFVASLKEFTVAGIDVDDKYIYLTGNSNLLVYDKETFELLVDKEFDYRTSSILVENGKALLGMWSNRKGRLISFLDVSNLNNISIEKTQKVDWEYLRRLNNKQIVFGKYSPNVRIFNFKSIDSLYDNMFNTKNVEYRECKSNQDIIFKGFTLNDKIIQVCNENKNIRYSFGKYNDKQEIELVVPKSDLRYKPWTGMGRYISEYLCIPNGSFEYCFNSSVDRSLEDKKIEQSLEVYNNSEYINSIEINSQKECISNPLKEIDTLLVLPSCPD